MNGDLRKKLPKLKKIVDTSVVSDKAIAIQANNLTKSFGAVKAIDRVSFEVQSGQIVGFLGPNGAGKSTTMRILCGLLEATSGVASINGISIASQPTETKRLIGYMPERNPLPEDMRVIEYLRYRAHLKEIPRKNIKQAVEEAMQLCDLNRKASRRIIGTLSKGYRQRVGIADAVLGNPEIIIMDEPTIGLDPHQILGIRRLINSLRGKMTVMISSHILPEIEMCCDRVIIINHGRIVAHGSSASLRKEFIPRTTYRIAVKATSAEMESILGGMQETLSLVSEQDTDDGYRLYFIETTEDTEIAEFLLSKLNERNCSIREIARLEPNLEDIFMAATKRSWDQEQPGRTSNTEH